MADTPRECTLVFLLSGQCVYLAMKKDKYGKGKLSGYGGMMEEQDRGNPKLCAVRELKEESGVETQHHFLYLVAVVDFYKAGVHDLRCHVYWCQEYEGLPKEGKEMGPPELHSISQLPFEDMMPADKEWLARIFKGERWSIKVPYNGDQTALVGSIEYEPLRR